jgi:O-antigen/teichoic acid export membrane protein
VSAGPIAAPIAPVRVCERLASHLRVTMFREGYALVLSGAVTAVLGLVYWLVAAWSYSPSKVGVNSAAISAMTLLAGLSQLNLGSALVRFVPTAGASTRRLVLGSYAVSMAVAGVVSAIFVLGVSWWVPRLEVLREPWLFALFVVGAMVWCVFVLEDAALAGLRRAAWVPASNGVFSIVKLGLLVGFVALFPRFGIFGSWTAAAVIAVVPTTILIVGRLIPKHVSATTAQAEPLTTGDLRRFVAPDYLAALAWLVSVNLVPLIVTQALGATANAYYTLAWVLVLPLFLVNGSMGWSLVVSGARERDSLDAYTHRMFVQTMRLVVPLSLAVVAVGPLCLRVFGQDYDANGSTALRLIALSAIPNAVNTIYICAARVRRDMARVVAVMGGACLLLLALVEPLIRLYGLTGVGIAWLVSQSVVAGIVVIRARPGVWVMRAAKGVK